MANPAQGWINHLRRQARNNNACSDETRAVGNQAAPSASVRVDGALPCVDHGPEDVSPARKRLKSPTTSVDARNKSSINSSCINRPSSYTTDFPVRPTAKTKGRLWNEGDPVPTRSQAASSAPTITCPTRRRERPSRSAGPLEEEDPSVNTMIGQPETRSISQEQLVAQVGGIYAGLVMVESKCIEVDSSQSAQNESNPKLNNEQWQALIALHRTLLHEHHDFFLASQHPSATGWHGHHDFFSASQHPSANGWHEHHDFFLASQHPSASPALKRLASKYTMPARMWRHGIRSFLELLRHRLPESASPDHKPTFIYLAYSMMALLYKTVSNVEDTWIECLGDLGRYRMAVAIENEDIHKWEIWREVSRYWYPKTPTTGRLYHHVAILARPNAVKQLFYYTKSLCVTPRCSYYEGASVSDPRPTKVQSDQDDQSMGVSQTERPLPVDRSLHGLLWADSLYPDDRSRSGTLDEGEREFELPQLLKGGYERAYRRETGGDHFASPGVYSEPFNGLQSKCHSDGRNVPRYILNPLYLLSTFPRKFIGLAILSAMAIPIVSAELPGRDVVTMAWAFGVMANVPSVYVLANPPVPSGADDGAEEILWKIARGWGLTLGPVFATVLVVLLRTILPREKRVAFIALVFAMSVVVMLLLKLFMMDDTWSVLDLLALCVSFCGVAAYIITSEPRGVNRIDGDLGLEGGHPQHPQGNVAGNQPLQPTRAVHQDGAGDDLAAVQSSTRSHDPFIIGDDSTLGDGESRT